MAQESIFTKRHVEPGTDVKKELLEQLNLPPKMIAFLRTNSTRIQIGLAVGACLSLAWSGYGQYREAQREKGTAMMYNAMQATDAGERSTLLQTVIKKYGSDEAGQWAKVELAHAALKAGNHAEAIAGYQQVLAKLSSAHPLLPLLTYGLAQAYEQSNDLENAKKYYQQLTELPGFGGEGYLGLGRICETNKETAKAKEMYEKYLALPETAESPTKKWVAAKIAKL